MYHKNTMISSKYIFYNRGYGLSSTFRSILRFLRPIKHQIINTLKDPATKSILKSVGEEAMSTGTQLLL